MNQLTDLYQGWLCNFCVLSYLFLVICDDRDFAIPDDDNFTSKQR